MLNWSYFFLRIKKPHFFQLGLYVDSTLAHETRKPELLSHVSFESNNIDFFVCY